MVGVPALVRNDIGGIKRLHFFAQLRAGVQEQQRLRVERI